MNLNSYPDFLLDIMIVNALKLFYHFNSFTHSTASQTFAKSAIPVDRMIGILKEAA